MNKEYSEEEFFSKISQQPAFCGLRTIQKYESLSDVGLVDSTGKKYRLHKTILGFNSDYFLSIFNDKDFSKGEDRSNPIQWEFKKTDSVLPNVIHFFYSGEILVNPKNWASLFSCALQLKASKLLSIMENRFKETIQVNNIMEYFFGCLEFEETQKPAYYNQKFNPLSFCIDLIAKKYYFYRFIDEIFSSKVPFSILKRIFKSFDPESLKNLEKRKEALSCNLLNYCITTQMLKSQEEIDFVHQFVSKFGYVHQEGAFLYLQFLKKYQFQKKLEKKEWEELEEEIITNINDSYYCIKFFNYYYISSENFMKMIEFANTNDETRIVIESIKFIESKKETGITKDEISRILDILQLRFVSKEGIKHLNACELIKSHCATKLCELYCCQLTESNLPMVKLRNRRLTRWISQKSPRLNLSCNKKIVSIHEENWRNVYGDLKIDSKGIYSWKIKILKNPKHADFTIGIGDKNEKDSIFIGSGCREWVIDKSLKPYNNGTFSTSYADEEKGIINDGDVIEVCLDLLDIRKGKLSFFLNGKPLGINFLNISPPIYPACSVKSIKSPTTLQIL